MTIRPAKAADIPRIMDIERAAPTAAHRRDEDYAGMFSETGVKRMFLALEQRGVVQAFVVAQIATVEWEIENIAVAPEAQRRGYATLLLKRFLDEAHKAGAISIHLEVRESNEAARKLYQKAGFAEVGRRTHYYSNPQEDALAYRLSLA
jgi:[ribosomal protein S18]-alanine N-acetyltransferase